MTDLRGRLEDVDLADLLEYLRDLGATGRLALKFGTAEKVLCLRGGRLVFALSNLPAERLGDMLLQDGKITQEQYDEAERGLAVGKRMGKSLVEAGALGPADLWAGVRNQVLQIAFSVMAWDSGLFHFSENEAPPEESIQVDVPVQEVIVEGVRRIRDRKRIARRFPKMDVVFQRVPAEERPDLPNLQDHEKHVFRLVNGNRSVEQICASSDIGEFETLKALYIFHAANYVRIRPEEELLEENADRVASLRDLVREYNGCFAQVYGQLLNEVGPIAENVAEKYFAEVKGRHNTLLGQCFLRKDGTIAADGLLNNLRRMPVTNQPDVLKQGLSDMLRTFVVAVEKVLGPDNGRRVRMELPPFGQAALAAPVSVTHADLPAADKGGATFGVPDTDPASGF